MDPAIPICEIDKAEGPHGLLDYRPPPFMRIYSDRDIKEIMQSMEQMDRLLREHDERRRLNADAERRLVKRWSRQWVKDRFIHAEIWLLIHTNWTKYRKYVRTFGLFLLFDAGFAAGWWAHGP